MIYYVDQTHKDPTCIPHDEGTIDLTTLDYGDNRIYWAMAPRWVGRVTWTNPGGQKVSYNPNHVVDDMIDAWGIIDPDEDYESWNYWYEELDIEIVWALDTKTREFRPMAVELPTGDVYDILAYRFIDGHSHHWKDI